MNDQRKLWGSVLLVIGVIALIVGVVYLTVYAKSLPGFLGPVHNYPGHRSNRGTSAVIVGLVLLAGGGWLVWSKPAPADSTSGGGGDPASVGGSEPAHTEDTGPTATTEAQPKPADGAESTPASDAEVSQTPPPTP